MSLWPDDSEDEYHPPSASESEGSELQESPVILKTPTPAVNYAVKDGDSSSEEEEKGEPSQAEDVPMRGRKRRRRSAGLDPPEGRLPYKRIPGVFNMEYLGLLNEDIDDAKEQIIADPNPNKLPGSQIGMVVWSATEKQLFFNAVGRLGKDDLPGLASRIQTKSVVEIAQYIQLLEKEVGERIARNRDIVIKADIPAAAEVSLQCCLALDAVADELSLRQQRFEEKQEQQKWDEFPWAITQSIASEMERNLEAQDEPFVKLFHLPTWLTLSDRVFMNASFPENNWHFVDEEPPSIRSTALQDFHNLTVSLTRRIVSAALFFAEARVRSKAPTERRIKDLVKRRDIFAAVESLGLSRDSSQFWARCPRRLKLDVYDDGDIDDSDVESGAEGDDNGMSVLSFTDAERALGLSEDPRLESSAESESGDEADGSNSEEAESEGSEPVDKAHEEFLTEEAAMDDVIQKEIDDAEVQMEARELLFQTALDIPPSRRTINAVKRRIIVERNHEAYADSCDEVASTNEELKLWEILRLEPPEVLASRDRVVEQAKRDAVSTDDYLKRQDWRKSIKYVSEWEVTPRM
ncbi:hypothetical protein jhhlp_003537 [Lomentospora prolificans]|uniref:Myb-like domain-containing protein n=1 Tax=Lomentospora prolificans TaxID=41688 RepID=A0A2N3N935_9PEZI|nr:hypothetical protein jhhlp_003537 [Lomentospora prolificans]